MTLSCRYSDDDATTGDSEHDLADTGRVEDYERDSFIATSDEGEDVWPSYGGTYARRSPTKRTKRKRQRPSLVSDVSEDDSDESDGSDDEEEDTDTSYGVSDDDVPLAQRLPMRKKRAAASSSTASAARGNRRTKKAKPTRKKAKAKKPSKRTSKTAKRSPTTRKKSRKAATRTPPSALERLRRTSTAASRSPSHGSRASSRTVASRRAAVIHSPVHADLARFRAAAGIAGPAVDAYRHDPYQSFASSPLAPPQGLRGMAAAVRRVPPASSISSMSGGRAARYQRTGRINILTENLRQRVAAAASVPTQRAGTRTTRTTGPVSDHFDLTEDDLFALHRKALDMDGSPPAAPMGRAAASSSSHTAAAKTTRSARRK